MESIHMENSFFFVWTFFFSSWDEWSVQVTSGFQDAYPVFCFYLSVKKTSLLKVFKY